MDNEDVRMTRRGKEQILNAPPRTRGRGRREEPNGSSSQSQIDIEIPSS